MSIPRRKIIRVGKNVKIYWQGYEFRQKVFKDADDIAMKSARLVAAVAGGLVQARAKRPKRRLSSQIVAIKSKFDGGGAVAWAQAPGHWSGKYHASFVALGTKKRISKSGRVTAVNQKPLRYMRDAADMLAPPTFERFKRAFLKNIKQINKRSADEIRL